MSLADTPTGRPSIFTANQRWGFMEIRHCDWLSPKVGHGRRRGRLLCPEPSTVTVPDNTCIHTTSGFTFCEKVGEFHNSVCQGTCFLKTLWNENSCSVIETKTKFIVSFWPGTVLSITYGGEVLRIDTSESKNFIGHRKRLNNIVNFLFSRTTFNEK